jgi:hypothetical protein
MSLAHTLLPALAHHFLFPALAHRLAWLYAGGQSITYKLSELKIPCVTDSSVANNQVAWDVCFGYAFSGKDGCTTVAQAVKQAEGSKCKCQKVALPIIVLRECHAGQPPVIM